MRKLIFGGFVKNVIFGHFVPFLSFFFNAKKRQFGDFSDMQHVTYQMKGNFMANWPVKEYCTKNVIFCHFVPFLSFLNAKNANLDAFQICSMWHIKWKIISWLIEHWTVKDKGYQRHPRIIVSKGYQYCVENNFIYYIYLQNAILNGTGLIFLIYFLSFILYIPTIYIVYTHNNHKRTVINTTFGTDKHYEKRRIQFKTFLRHLMHKYSR